MEEVPLNKQHIYLFGMRRSGNHVFADWLKSLGEGGWHHYNNCVIRENGMVKTGQLEGDENGVNSLVTFEDMKYKEAKEKLPRRWDILLLRDPYTLFASRLMHIRIKEDSPIDMICKDAIKTWKENADAFMCYDPSNVVSFNEWYESENYRALISEQLGFPFSDEGFGSKAGWRFSGGSSFNGDPSPFESYKKLFDDKEYLSLFDEEIVDLAKCNFDIDPPPNLKYDKDFVDGVEKIVTQVLWAVHQGSQESARSLLDEGLRKYPHSSRLSQLLHYA
jgi:hypothetical protein